MKNIFIKRGLKLCATIAMLAGVAVSCTGNFYDINTNPYEPTSRNKLSFLTEMQKNVIHVSKPNPYQLSQSLVGDIFSGYMAPIGTWEGNRNTSTYVFPIEWTQHPYENIFAPVVNAYMEVLRSVKGDKTSHVMAFADLLKVSAMHRFADNWGPMQYLGIGESLSPPYDSQEVVYNQFFAELENSINVLTNFVNANPSSLPMADYDLVYGGDYRKWVIYANSLRLRLAMRVSEVNPELAKIQAEAAVAHEMGVMTNNGDNAAIKSGLGQVINNPLEIMCYSYDEIVMGASITSIMNGYADPRREKYATSSTLADVTNGCIGLRNGLVNSGTNANLKLYSVPIVTPTTPMMWLNSAEVAFLKSEGALRGWNMGGETAEVAYETGVKLSFEQWDAKGHETYLDSETLPANYVDPKSSINSISAMSKVPVKFGAAGSSAIKEQIITQKWLAMFPNGQEGWSEYRRTGFPKIFPVKTNYSGGKINTTLQVRRSEYPYKEKTLNPENYAAAVELLGGPDTGGTPVWWDTRR